MKGGGARGRAALAGQVLAEPADVGGRVGGLADRGGAGGADHGEQLRRVDGALGEAGVPVPARTLLVPGVVAVHQVDPAGDRLDTVHDAIQILAAGQGVTGVQAESDVVVQAPGYGLPEPGQGVQPSGHRPVAAGRVLDQHRHRPLDPLDRLAPVLVAGGRIDPGVHVAAVHDQALGPDGGGRRQMLAEQFAAGDADPVVRGGHVDPVRGVHEHLDARLGERVLHRGRVAAREYRRLPVLRVTKKELCDGSIALFGLGQRIFPADVCPDARHAPSLRGRPPGWGQSAKPPWANPRPTPTNAATRPVTITIRWFLVAEIIWSYIPTNRASRPSTTAGKWATTMKPSMNAGMPAIRVKTAREFSSGCRWPSSLSEMTDI